MRLVAHIELSGEEFYNEGRERGALYDDFPNVLFVMRLHNH